MALFLHGALGFAPLDGIPVDSANNAKNWRFWAFTRHQISNAGFMPTATKLRSGPLALSALEDLALLEHVDGLNEACESTESTHDHPNRVGVTARCNGSNDVAAEGTFV
jgi:hypothetical protein